MLESELASPTPLLLQQHYRKPKILFTQSLAGANPLAVAMTSSHHVYEVRPRKDHRGVDLISDLLPFGRL
jgi:hypothetical protein